MPWLLLDVAVVLVALLVVGACGLRLWRGVKALSREVGTAGTRIGTASDALALVQPSPPPSPVPAGRPDPTGARHRRDPRARGRRH